MFVCVLSLVLSTYAPMWVFAGLLTLWVLTTCYLKIEAHKEVHTTPKVPMSMCDKHGLYPKSASLTYTATAVGRPDIPIEMCPFCYDERIKEAEKVLQ